MRSLTVLALAALVGGGAVACAGRDPSVETTLLAYRRALEHDDPVAAYRLLSPDARAGLPEKVFVERWRASSPERERLLAALRAEVPAKETVTVRLTDGRSLELERLSEGWRVRTARPLPPHITSPDELLRRLDQALAERSYQKLVDLFGDELRALVEKQLADRLAALRAGKPGHFDAGSEKIRIRLGDYYLELSQKNGSWKISDFN